jgi:hypothetical protein
MNFSPRARPTKSFRLKLEYKLVGTEGFVNGGVQFPQQAHRATAK